MKQLEGFHLRAAWKMVAEHVSRWDPVSGKWVSSPSTTIRCEEADYSLVHIALAYLRFLCGWYRRRRCSSPHQIWWEQPMDMDLAREAEAEASETGSEEEDGGLGLDN